MRAGAARASLEHDQDLALLDHLALLHPHLFHGAGTRRGNWDFHLHRLEDQELVLLRHLCAGLGLDLPDAPDQLGLDFSHSSAPLTLPLLPSRGGGRIFRASSPPPSSPPRSLTTRAAFLTSPPLVFAI